MKSQRRVLFGYVSLFWIFRMNFLYRLYQILIQVLSICSLPPFSPPSLPSLSSCTFFFSVPVSLPSMFFTLTFPSFPFFALTFASFRIHSFLLCSVVNGDRACVVNLLDHYYSNYVSIRYNYISAFCELFNKEYLLLRKSKQTLEIKYFKKVYISASIFVCFFFCFIMVSNALS